MSYLKKSSERKSYFSEIVTPSFEGMDLKKAKEKLNKIKKSDEFANRFFNVLAIPSCTGQEAMLAEFSLLTLRKEGFMATIDEIGNIYATKGSGPWPLFCAHLDTVHQICNYDLWMSEDGWIGAVDIQTKEQCGIGGDDKCGVFACLEMAAHLENVKIALFASEENGCIGSSQANRNFFKGVCYAFGVDSPELGIISEACSGIQLFDREGEFWNIAAPILKKHVGTPELDLQRHPYTDVQFVRGYGTFPCPNISAGYYNWHTSGEITTLDAMKRIVSACKELTETLDRKVFDEGPSKRYVPERFRIPLGK